MFNLSIYILAKRIITYTYEEIHNVFHSNFLLYYNKFYESQTFLYAVNTYVSLHLSGYILTSTLHSDVHKQWLTSKTNLITHLAM